MDKISRENVVFYNFRKLAEAERRAGKDAKLEDIIKIYDSLAGKYEILKSEKAAKTAVTKSKPRRRAPQKRAPKKK